MAANSSKSGTQNPSLVVHAVNLRRREVPPLSDYLMGNLLGIAFAQCTPKTETDIELGSLVLQLKEAIAKKNCEFLKKLKGDQGFYNLCESVKEMGGALSNVALSKKGAEYILFSSWCHFGFYEVDFGWGTPMWATISGPREEESSAILSFVCLIENKWGDGIEALVALEEQDMAILECDKELLAFASLNPSALQAGRYSGDVGKY